MKVKKIVSITLIFAMLLATLAIFPVFAGTDGEVELIDPFDGDGNFIFDTDNATLGSTFKVQVWFYPNASQNVTGWQYKIQYDTSLLDFVSETLPTGHMFEGLTFSHPAASVDEGAGTIMSMAILITPPSIIVSTDKIMSEMTFQITKMATKTEPFVNCSLTFYDIGMGGTYFIDGAGHELDMNYFGGYYEFSWVAPSEVPWLEVKDPVDGDNTITATYVGQELDVDIWIHGCAAAWEQIGIQFQLWYNTTLISYVGTGTNPDWVNGTFMELFIGDGLGIFYVVKADFEGVSAPLGENYFMVMLLKLPNGSGQFNPPFPDGSGKIITLKIESLIQGLFPIKYECDLTLKNVKFIDRDGNELGQGTHVSGKYEIEPKVLGRMVDVYTQYPYPFGGQGLYKPSDMFWPQKHLLLCANVTYNEWPEQNKDVAFQIIDPHDTTWGIYYNRTNNVGVACVFVRLPWPCDDPEYYIGEWTVIATVDVACDVVNDTLSFKYDYLVNVWDVVPDKIEYKHCECINATISLASYAMQKYNVTITMTVYDETGVPFGYISTKVEIGEAQYCTYKEYELELSVHVIKFARAGKATIHVGALSDFPFYGGCALSPPFETSVSILAEWA